MPVGDRRDAIIAAAIEVVAAAGLSGLSYRVLAAKAGVSLGAVQHHFGSIDEVLAAALERSLQTSLDVMRRSATIQVYLDQIRAFLVGPSDVQVFQMHVSLAAQSRAGLGPIVRASYESCWAATERALSGVLDDGIDRRLVRAVLAAAEGIIYQRIVLRDDDPDDVDVPIEGLRLLIDAIRASGPNAPGGATAAPPRTGAGAHARTPGTDEGKHE